MGEEEILVFVLSAVAGLLTAFVTNTSRLPRVYTHGNPGIGLMRLSVAASVLWTAYVIQFHGDPSIQGVYVLFYLVMAYSVTKVFGQLIPNLYGVRLRRDIYERKNWAVSLFIAAFALGTGIIFGGSLWGEADPLSDGEGGWWIPVGFFLLGWSLLALSTSFYLWREPGRFRRQMRQDRDVALAWSVAVYILATSTLILDGVAGDFWGWRHGILGLGAIGLMLAGHEFVIHAGSRVSPSAMMRVAERFVYIGLAAAAWAANRMIDQLYMGGG